ncbi:MAG: hypothetical protein IJ644_03720 [Oscillospiraceae bacterium]|nr:hypothetical protein [Oscillospiraceae bacterium]
MRKVNVYYDANNGLTLAAADLIQIEDASVSRTPSGRSFVMADGSVTFYPAENDIADFTLILECNGTQAERVAAAVRYGKLYFSGMRAGGTAADEEHVFTGFITEQSSVSIQEISSAADVYNLRIPMKLLVSGGHYVLKEVNP